MKASVDKVQKGIMAYIDNELINHLEGWAKIGFGAASALVIKNLPGTLEQYAKHPFVVMLGVIDADGNIDIDALHDAVADYFKSEGEYVNVPMIGRMKFTKSDVESLYRYIKEA